MYVYFFSISYFNDCTYYERYISCFNGRSVNKCLNFLDYLVEYYKILAVPNNINYDNVITDLCMIENVKKVHSLHIWCLTTEKMCLNVHLVTGKFINLKLVLVLIKYNL